MAVGTPVQSIAIPHSRIGRHRIRGEIDHVHADRDTPDLGVQRLRAARQDAGERRHHEPVRDIRQREREHRASRRDKCALYGGDVVRDHARVEARSQQVVHTGHDRGEVGSQGQRSTQLTVSDLACAVPAHGEVRVRDRPLMRCDSLGEPVPEAAMSALAVGIPDAFCGAVTDDNESLESHWVHFYRRVIGVSHTRTREVFAGAGIKDQYDYVMRLVAAVAFALSLGCPGGPDVTFVHEESADLDLNRAPLKPIKPLEKPVAAAIPAKKPEPPPPPPPPTTVKHSAPGDIEEVCQLLVPFPFTPPDVKNDPKAMRWYRKDDFDEVAEMCAMSLHAPATTETVTAVGICPKTHWSTPALEIHAIDQIGMTKVDFEKSRCLRDRRFRGAKKVAKFKANVYYKESESQRTYFHFSRLLGASPFIMPATYRTVSRAALLKWVGSAVRTLRGGPLARLNPLQGWFVLYDRHHRSTATVIEGTLSENARGEKYFKPFTYYADQRTRITTAEEFRLQSYYKLVASKKPVSEQLVFDPAKPKRFDQALQALAIAQDFTHMIILDTLFNQTDRGGNINGKVRYHYLSSSKKTLKWKKAPDKDDDAETMVPLDRLLLKDNDDGLRWGRYGPIRASIIIDEILHLDSLTYERLQWIANHMTDEKTRDAVKTYFVDHARVTEKVYDEVRLRVIDLAAKFEKKHAAGKLHLDLDLEPALAARRSVKTASTP